ncbi:Uncharacterized protein DBV15_09628 [Temnothorax longispinosus]|uniref:Uncharacterized protein n=1 Tax=Temnothorax longispinosus TaxID=300112 RepID=A0A4V3SCX0_9HYME|nr:Uncharacterized protein DBV15_09628 [Temnothorax longispinosus]
MSGDANQARTDDWNLTAGFDLVSAGELGNVTDELYPLPDYINVTSLPDVNTTEEIDSFYFYEIMLYKMLSGGLNHKADLGRKKDI